MIYFILKKYKRNALLCRTILNYDNYSHDTMKQGFLSCDNKHGLESLGEHFVVVVVVRFREALVYSKC